MKTFSNNSLDIFLLNIEQDTFIVKLRIELWNYINIFNNCSYTLFIKLILDQDIDATEATEKDQ